MCTYYWLHADALPEHVFDLFVELHESDVGEVPEEEDQSLIPPDLVVHEEHHQQNQGDRVEKSVADQGPCRQPEKQHARGLTFEAWFRYYGHYQILK